MRIKTEEIIGGVYLIGGPNITSADDAAIYLIDFEETLVLIDAGAGRDFEQIVRNIEFLGFKPAKISHLILNKPDSIIQSFHTLNELKAHSVFPLKQNEVLNGSFLSSSLSYLLFPLRLLRKDRVPDFPPDQPMQN